MSEVATQSADAADKVHTILVDTSKTALVNFDLVLKDIVKVTAVAKVGGRTDRTILFVFLMKGLLYM